MHIEREIRILEILGFKQDVSLEKFLENIIYNVEKSTLHNQGIAKVEVETILRKINPQHKIFEKENLIKEAVERENREMAGYFLPSI